MDESRIKKVQQQLDVDCLLIDDPVDLFYLTGLTLSIGRMALFPDRASLFVDGRYIEIGKKKAPCEVKLNQEFVSYLSSAQKVGFDSAFLSCDDFAKLEKQLPQKKWVPLSKPLKEMRAVKEGREIETLKKAARLTWEGFLHIRSLLKEGISESELALEFEFFCRRKGASALSFSPIIAFGENSAFPHHRAGNTKLKKNQIALFDLGAVVDGYAGDMTRVIFFGEADPELQKDYQLIQQAQALAIDAIRPGVQFGELDRIAREYLRKAGVADLFTHGLSHGIGLETHEFPFLRIEGGDRETELTPGMVFTVEPGLYRPARGGVRYEDTVLVTKTGAENFFPSDNG